MSQKSNRKQLVLTFLYVIWVTVVIALYFVVHKPGEPGQLLAPIGVVIDLSVAVILVVVGGGLGRRFAGSLADATPVERLVIHCAIGLGALGLVIFVFGLLGLYRLWIVLLVLITFILLLRRNIVLWLGDWKYVFKSLSNLYTLEKFSALFILILISLNLFLAFAPPLKWDSLAYHLELPKQYIANGRLIYLNDNLFNGFPQMAELLYTWAMLLSSGSSAATLGWAVGVVTIVGIGGFAGRLVDKSVTWLAPAILITGFSISQTFHWAYIDQWVMLFGLSMFIALDYYVSSHNKKWLIIAGISVGFALWTKYSAGLLVPLGVLYLLVHANNKIGFLNLRSRLKINKATSEQLEDANIRDGSFSNVIPDIVIFCAIAFITVLPWLLKNQILTGNPIYPFLLPGRDVDALRQMFHGMDRPERTYLNDILLPIQVTIFSIEGGVIEGYPPYLASIGPLLLALIPGIFVGWDMISVEKRVRYSRLLFILGATWLGWIVVAYVAGALSRSRHFFGVFPVLAVLAAAGFYVTSKVTISKIRLGVVLSAMIVLTYGLSLVNVVYTFVDRDPLPVLSGLKSKQEYLEEELGWYAVVMQVLNELPEDSKVKFFWEPRAYYCSGSCSPDVILDNWWYLRRIKKSNNAIANHLRSQGFTHLLMYDLGAQLVKDDNSIIQPSDWEELNVFLSEELKLVHRFGDSYSLYKFDER